MSIIDLGKSVVTEVTTHWSKPAKGKQVCYREMGAYSAGGVGVKFIESMVGTLALSTASLILTISIGIKIVDLQTMVLISTIIGMATGPVRGMIFDNTRSKAGKFRPYLLTMGVPSAFFAILMVYMPYDAMSYGQRFITVLVLYNLLNLFSPFFFVAYNSMPMVMSSNSDERTQVLSYSTVIFSLAPTITGAVLPLMGDMSKLSTYKLAIPLFSIIGAGIALLAFFGTKERIIVSKQYKPKVSFFSAIGSLAVNKFFWIIYGSGWISFLNISYGSLFNWIFILGMNKDNDKAGLLSLLTLLAGTASLPGMLFAAPIIKKFGKKNVAIFSSLVQILGLFGMVFCGNSYILIFLFMYVKNFAGSIAMIYVPAMKADVLDYQQYRTGTRLEGMMDQVGGFIGSILALGTGYVMPLILKTKGLTNNYEDLKNDEFRNMIVVVVVVCSIFGTLMSTIPYFFYDLSEKKHRNIIKVLRIRALFMDNGNQELDDQELIRAMEDIRAAEEVIERINKDTTDKTEKETLLAAEITLNELNKFRQREMAEQVSRARTCFEAGPQTVAEPDLNAIYSALAFPEETKEEKRLRRTAIKAAEKDIQHFEKSEKKYIRAKKLIEEEENYSKYSEIEERYETLIAKA